ncbi:class I SAM-dependent methyltransferase [Patescibacteria group bacterium]
MNRQQYFLNIFLKKIPVFQAVFRAVEAAGLAGYDFKEPILDLGCGDGFFTQALLGKGKKIYGLDINIKALNIAEKRKTYFQIVNSKANKIPFPNNYFNTILANSSLEHIKKLRQVLKECIRILKINGSLILTAPSEKREKYFAGNLHNKFFSHLNCWSGQKWQKELSDLGFRKISWQYVASRKTCFISGLFLPFAPIAWLEKKIFGHFLGYRKFTYFLVKLIFKNFNDKVKNDNGAVIIIRAIK